MGEKDISSRKQSRSVDNRLANFRFSGVAFAAFRDMRA
jgi:hypothetical protein